MTKSDLLSLAPLIINAIGPIILMLAVVVRRNFFSAFMFSLSIFAGALFSIFLLYPYSNPRFTPLIILDNFSIIFLGIIYLTGLLIAIFSYEYFRKHGGEREEFFIILSIATLGASFIVISDHFVSFFLGLETLSISLFILIPFLRDRGQCIEAGAKFLVIASLSTAFLLFGMGLIYSLTGNLSFQVLLSDKTATPVHSPLFIAGFIMILAGIGFKLAVVPFHMWAPDIYHGAPVPVAMFIATISKGAVLALTIRLFDRFQVTDTGVLFNVIAGISVLSMFTGNFLALGQRNIKRLLAYSSVSHMGYMLIPILAATDTGVASALFYVIVYILSTLGAFGVISALSASGGDLESIDDLKGLFRSEPTTATALTISVLSLAGLPLTAGFMSKFFLVLSGARSGLWLLAFSLIINSVISLYYYLRVVKALFAESDHGSNNRVSFITRMLLAVIAIVILILGIVPSGLERLTNTFGQLLP